MDNQHESEDIPLDRLLPGTLDGDNKLPPAPSHRYLILKDEESSHKVDSQIGNPVTHLSWNPVPFRALGLQFLLPRLWRREDEPAKIAFAKVWRLALLRGLIHILPVSAAIALIVLNCKGPYVGNSAEWVSMLQFVAEVFELLMQASLVAVLFTYVRYECVMSGGMPLGALFAGLHSLQLSYLWSLEFLGSLSATCLRGRRNSSSPFSYLPWSSSLQQSAPRVPSL